jgi:hypothetical protein
LEHYTGLPFEEMAVDFVVMCKVFGISQTEAHKKIKDIWNRVAHRDDINDQTRPPQTSGEGKR